MTLSNTLRDVAAQGKTLWELRDMKNEEVERLNAAKFMLEAAEMMQDSSAKVETVNAIKAQIAELEASIKDYWQRIASLSGEYRSLMKTVK